MSDRLLGDNKKKEPITEIGKGGIIGVELLIEPDDKTIQFFSLTSSQKGHGRRIVESIVNAAPDDWTIVVVMDWSSGFWYKMVNDHPQIVIL